MEAWRLELYRLHSGLSSHKRKVDIAKALIRKALGMGNWYVAWSGGKDSNALLHLVHAISPNMPIVHVETELDFPDCREQIHRWIDEWGIAAQTTVLRPSVSPWDILDKHGGPELQSNNSQSELDRRCFYEPIEQHVAERGYTGVFLGLRAEESAARRLNRRTRGVLYRTRLGLMRCNPLSDWTVEDVWAYTLTEGLPWLPVYDKVHGHPDPERIREGWWAIGGYQASRGGLLWLRLNYPTLYRELQRRYPHYTAQV